jgi:membrane protein DedA with SNARE-associated domain
VQSVTGPVVDLIDSIGEVGVGVLLALETVVPPIPSEVVLPFAGFAASSGRIDPFLAWVAATIGSLLGAYLLYGLGRKVSYERLEDLAGRRWFILFGQRDLARGHRFFERHGSAIVFFGRFVPLVRSIVSVPAGLERMPLGRFTLLTAAGSGVWNALFIVLGYRLGQDYTVVERWISPLSKVVVALVALALVWLAVRRRREQRAVDEAVAQGGTVAEAERIVLGEESEHAPDRSG